MSEIRKTVAEQLQQLKLFMHREMFSGYQAGGNKHNPHRGQGRVLAMLKIKPEISQKELHFLLGMSKQSLAELLVKLEKNGFITREQSESDRRAVTIKLTDEGMKAANDVSYHTSRTIEVLEYFTDEELTIFSGYLERIILRFEEQFPEEDFEERRKMMRKFMAQKGFGAPAYGRNRNGPGDLDFKCTDCDY